MKKIITIGLLTSLCSGLVFAESYSERVAAIKAARPQQATAVETPSVEKEPDAPSASEQAESGTLDALLGYATVDSAKIVSVIIGAACIFELVSGWCKAFKAAKGN